MARTFYIRSVRNEVLRWRPHSFGVITDKPALGFEPSLLKARQMLAEPLIAESLPHGFRWDAGTAAKVIVRGVRGQTELLAYDCPKSGESQWRQWPGCSYVDLFPLGGDGSVAGEIVRLRRLIHASGVDVEFAQGGSRNEVTIRPMSAEVASGKVVVWHRIQRNQWQRNERGVLGRRGRTERIPDEQGAFAVEGPARQLWGLQLFGFGWLAPMSDGTRQEMADIYPLDTSEGEWDDWPLWMLQQFVNPLVAHLSTSPETPIPLHERLRIAARRELFAGALPGFNDWRPDLTIEEFAGERWPEMAAVLSLQLPPVDFAQAFALRDSPTLAEALERAGGDASLLPTYIRVAPISISLRRVRSFLPHEGELWELTEEIQRALDDIGRARRDAEKRVVDSWARLCELVRSQIGVEITELDESTAADFVWSGRQSEVAKKLGLMLAADPIPMHRMSLLADELETVAAKPLREQVYRCLAAQLLPRDDFDREYGLRRAQAAEAMSNLLTSIPERYAQMPSPSIRRITELCQDPDRVASVVACCMLEPQLRTWIEATLRGRGRDMGAVDDWTNEGQVPLETFLDAALQRAATLEERSSRAREERARRDEIVRWLPQGMDPESTEASESLAALLSKLGARVDALLGFFATEQQASADQGAVARAYAAMAATVPGPPAERRSAVARLLAQWTSDIEAIEGRVVAAIRQRTGAGEHVMSWLTRDGLASAQLAAVVERDGRRLLWSLKPPLAELLWLSSDPYLGTEGPRIANVVQDIGNVQSTSELERLSQAVGRIKECIKEQSGLAALQVKLVAERERRWRVFTSGWSGHEVPPISKLGGIMRAAGVETYGPNGPSIGAERVELTVGAGDVKQRLQSAGLWPSAERVAS